MPSYVPHSSFGRKALRWETMVLISKISTSSLSSSVLCVLRGQEEDIIGYLKALTAWMCVTVLESIGLSEIMIYGAAWLTLL